MEREARVSAPLFLFIRPFSLLLFAIIRYLSYLSYPSYPSYPSTQICRSKFFSYLSTH